MWALWNRVGNQWRASVGGPIALDYTVIFHLLDRMDLSKDDYDQLFDAVRVIESEQLAIWSEQREKEQGAK